MFFVVTDQIVKREPIMGGDEVNRGIGSPSGELVKIRTAAQTIGELTDQPGVPFPEPAHRVAVSSVPFRPKDRKITDLVPALPDVPWLGNKFHLGNDWILMDDFEKCCEFAHSGLAARKGSGQIEPETINMHVGNPIA